MEQDELPGALYDFLYRDTGRLTSYYSQLFEGHLTSLEQTDSDKDGSVSKITGNIQIATGEISKTEEIASSSKRTIDPHDLITTDVLTSLREGSFIRTDIQAAPHGALIQARGTIVFADKHILEMASMVFKGLAAEEKQKPRNRQDLTALNTYTMMEGLVQKVPLPSAFVLETLDGIQVAGTIKDAGMEEPISTYYFRHGIHGLADIYIIGIKEVPSEAFTLPATAFLEATKQMAQALTALLIPSDAVRVTPLAFFRKLESDT